MVFNASQQSDFTFQKNSGSDLSWVLVEQIFMRSDTQDLWRHKWEGPYDPSMGEGPGR
jgi:hypothetical protein